MNSTRVLVAMSGGVDSSVAAFLLHRQGREVVGVHMRNGAESAERGPAEDAKTTRPARGCCGVEDAYDARRVADRLGFPFHVLNYQRAFGAVMDDFADEYAAARTPNPCIRCNAWLKFGRLVSFARSLGIPKVATGHYARLVDRDGRLAVARAADAAKDQSYVLFPLTQEQLASAVFPLGDLAKPEVRAVAREAGLGVQDKPDSQGICFIPDDDPGRFLRERRPDLDGAGDFRTSDGTVVGRHRGYQFFTIGQRKGLGLALGRAMYVARIDPATRTVWLGDDSDLWSRTCGIDAVNWMGWAPPPPGERRPCAVQIRAHHEAAPAVVTALDGGRARIEFDAPQRAITPGQAAVIYDGEIVAGGGWIGSGAGRSPGSGVLSPESLVPSS